MKALKKDSNPNIILINCDDLGYGDLGCYGSKCNDTPFIDKLASEGVRFTEFYMAAPVCSASRAAMMTGCYSQRIGFGEYPVLFPGQKHGLNPKESTIAKQLKQIGYDTKLIGKWHCGDQKEFLPTNHGFDEYFGIPFSNDMGRQINALDHPPLPLMRNEEVIQEQPDQRGITERYMDESVQFMRRKRNKPFFLYLAHMYVHVPLFIPEPFLKSSRNGAYGGAVNCIDWAMGVIETELINLGIKEDTLIIFTSDNGSRARGEGGSNAPLRGVKGETWEGGLRVPCIMRWPGKIMPNSNCEGIATSLDFFATIAEITGAPLPQSQIDSISFTDALFHGQKLKREIFAYYKGINLEAIRMGDWKLHLSKDNVELQELYNLKDDVSESNNLYTTYKDIVAKIEDIVKTYRNTLGDDRLKIKGKEVREIGITTDPKPLTEYKEDHPYIVAYYDLADMPTMSG